MTSALLFAPLGAAPEVEKEAAKEFAPIGVRASHLGWLEQKEARAQFEQSLCDQCDEEVIQAPEKSTGVSAKLGKSAKINAQGAAISLPYDYAIYSGYDHWALYFSNDCKVVELEDESQWKVASYDVYRTLKWLTGDMIAVFPNTSWFSAYDYRIVNRNTGESVDASLIRGPLYSSVYTKFVSGVDSYYDNVYLTDGTRWKVSSSDHYKLSKWLVSDVVIIGMNDGFFSASSFPAILINVNLNEFVFARLQ